MARNFYLLVSFAVYVGACGSESPQSLLSTSQVQVTWPLEPSPRFALQIGNKARPQLKAPGPGAGAWGSEAPQLQNLVLKTALLAMLAQPQSSDLWGEEAVGTLNHYLLGSGEDYHISLEKLIREVPSVSQVYREMFAELKDLCISLPEGTYAVSPLNSFDSDIRPEENQNWYLAVAGYSAWIQGVVTITKNQMGDNLVVFRGGLFLWDNYDWDPGISVPVRTPLGTIRVEQDRLGELHRQGLSKEYETFGEIQVELDLGTAVAI